jgi:hypothetical protein
MTRGQQIVLLVILLLLIGVTGLLAVTLIRERNATSAAPTPAAVFTIAPTRPPLDTSTPVTVPPTWTALPTRTPRDTDTPGPAPTATSPPTITPTFAPTFTPQPTLTASPLPLTPTLSNPGFEGVRNNSIPGWSWWAADNFTPGGDYNPDSSFDTPLFKQADDPLRFINGPTLQVDAVQHLKFRVHIYQTVTVSPTARIGFQVMAGAFSDTGLVQMAAGIDPNGGPDCAAAKWSDQVLLDQKQTAQPIVAPQVVAGSDGQVTVCISAEPFFAAVSNAAFFDQAELTVNP